jgi:glutaredoxin 3
MAKVKIYSTPTCPYCQMTKEYLKNNKIDYEEYNVAEDEARLKEMVNKSHQMGVPVVDIDGEIVVGFDRALLAKLLHIA